MANSKYVILMAQYNIWQNDAILSASSKLTNEERRDDFGVSFGSIHDCFINILAGDHLWLNRFDDDSSTISDLQNSIDSLENWQDFVINRKKFDTIILNWARGVNDAWFDGELTWHSQSLGVELTKPNSQLAIEMFNRQSHLRGQIHGLLVVAGFGAKDTSVNHMPMQFVA